MATIANLSIGLSADSARLKKDLDKADRATKNWGNKQKKTLGGVTKAFKGIAVAVGAIGTSAIALRGMTNLARELSNLSNLTSISTTELQQIAPALGSIGMSTEKYADIIKDVNDKMNDFLQTGGGPMKDFFEQVAPLVDVTADSFKGLSGKEGLQLYVDSLQKAGLSQEQMTFYMEALASDSTMLLPLLRDNAAEMLRLGLAADQVVKGSVNDDLKNLGLQFEAITAIIRNTITNALGPLINSIDYAIEGWRMMITDFPAIITGLGAVAAAVTALTIVMYANPITLWVSLFTGLIVAAGALYRWIKNLSEAMGGFGALFTTVADAGKFEFNRIKLYGENLKLQLALIFNGIQDKWQQTIHKMAYSFAQWQDSIAGSGLGEFMGLSGGNADRVSTANGVAMGVLNDQFEALTAALNSNSEKLSEANPHIAKLEAAMKAGIELKVDGDPTTPDLTGGGSGGGTTPAIATPPDFYESLAEKFVSGLKTSFSNALATGDWKGFLDSALDSLTMGIINSFTEGLFKPFQDAMTGFMDNLFSSMGSLGSGGGGGFLSGIGDWLGGIFGAHDGGMVPTTPFSKSYADSVPTMLQPGELVVPKDQVGNFMNGAGGGGGGQTFNINVTGDVSRLTRSEIVKMMPEIAAGTNMLNKENGVR